jgi:thiamine-phosphate pyrophosphorylase
MLVERVLGALHGRGARVYDPFRDTTGRWDTVVIVNDRADVSRIASASGVHVGQDDLSPLEVRRVLNDRSIVGLSTHTPDQIDASASEPVDYVAIGPIFGTATKATGYDAVGLARVARAAAGPHPVVAIGGITLENCTEVVRAGAIAVAVISDLLTAGDPEARTRAFVDRLARV